MIELQQFCSTDPARPYIHKPFSIGKATFATNGYVCVRVSRVDGAPEQDKPNPGKLFADYFKDEPRGSLEVVLPEIKEDWNECSACGGSGKEHDCLDCHCGECDLCGGEGKNNSARMVKVKVGSAVYNAKYIQQLMALPGLRFPSNPPADAAAGFVFDGGEGLLMPLRWEDETDAIATVKL